MTPQETPPSSGESQKGIVHATVQENTPTNILKQMAKLAGEEIAAQIAKANIQPEQVLGNIKEDPTSIPTGSENAEQMIDDVAQGTQPSSSPSNKNQPSGLGGPAGPGGESHTKKADPRYQSKSANAQREGANPNLATNNLNTPQTPNQPPAQAAKTQTRKSPTKRQQYLQSLKNAKQMARYAKQQRQNKRTEKVELAKDMFGAILNPMLFLMLIRDFIALLFNALTLFIIPIGTILMAPVTLILFMAYFFGMLNKAEKEAVVKKVFGKGMWGVAIYLSFMVTFYFYVELFIKPNVREKAKKEADEKTNKKGKK